jgi:hypothetical protein
VAVLTVLSSLSSPVSVEEDILVCCCVGEDVLR